MLRPQYGIADYLRDGHVKLACLRHVGVLSSGGRQQRMRNADARSVENQQASAHGVVESERIDNGSKLAPAQGRAQRRREQRPARGVREAFHARAEYVVDDLGNRQLRPDLGCAALTEEPPELEGEQRIAPGGLEDLTENT